MTALIECRKITKVFGGGLFDRTRTVALDDFSLALQTDPPTITAIVGESGSGKTTLARVFLGLSEPSSGTVLYQGHDLTKLSGIERREFRRNVQVIFQDPFEVYNPFYQVDHVLTTPLRKFGLAKTNEEANQLIVEVLRTVGLRPEETLGRYPHQLSGGQRQRIMVARALLLRPKLIIADEPVSMIDASLRATVLGSLRQLNSEFGISIIYITHDLTTAYQISDNIIVLYRGSVAECGDVENVVRDPQHPYTRLLVGSVPLPDPEKLWAPEAAAALADQRSATPGCKFVDRCPSATAKCLSSVPSLYRTNDHRAVSCFLYENSPTIDGGVLDEVFVQPKRGRTAGAQ
jgi:oligopeptide/dipeptide ABC transporter ATP-binding protein